MIFNENVSPSISFRSSSRGFKSVFSSQTSLTSQPSQVQGDAVYSQPSQVPGDAVYSQPRYRGMQYTHNLLNYRVMQYTPNLGKG